MSESTEDIPEESEDKVERLAVHATIDLDHIERQLLEAVSSPGFGASASNGLLAHRYLRARVKSLEGREQLLDELIQAAPVILDFIKNIHEGPCMCGDSGECLACRVHELIPS